MKMCMGIAAVFILIFGFSTVNGFKNPPTLPEETIEGLKQIIMEKEDENRVLERRITIMEEERREYEQQITQMKEDMEQKAKIIAMWGMSISLFRPLLNSNPNMTDISCGCLPMATPPTTLKPSRIDYQCEGQWNRSYSLECDRGVCGTNQFPSCDEPVLWENVDVSYEDCQQVSLNGTSHLCGQGWRQEKKTSWAIGAGLLTELVKTSCNDCGDISTALDWQPWGPCSDGEGNMDRPGRICRRRGNTKIGFQEEEAAGSSNKTEPIEKCIQSKLHSFSMVEDNKTGIFHWSNNKTVLVELHQEDDECIYRGSFKEEDGSRVLVTGCQGEDRSIQIQSLLYGDTLGTSINGSVELLRGHGNLLLNDAVENTDFIQKFSGEQRGKRVKRAYVKNLDFSKQFPSSNNANRNLILPSLLALPIHVYMAPSWRSKYGGFSGGRSKAKEILSHVKEWFLHPSLKTKFDVTYIDSDIKSTNADLSPTGANLASLQTFVSAPSSGHAAIVYLTIAPGGHLGIAYINTICDTDKKKFRSISKWAESDIYTAQTVAHEMGHNLGYYHDFDTTTGNGRTKACGPGKWENGPNNDLMNYAGNSELTQNKWSACSNEDFRNYFDIVTSSPGSTFCLKDKCESLTRKMKSLAAVADDPLNSICSKQKRVKHGVLSCSEEENICFLRCDVGYKINTFECIDPNTSQQLVVTGGYDGKNNLATSELMSANGVLCHHKIPNLPVAVHGASSVYFNNHLLVCGGRSDSGYQDSCHQLGSSTSTWTPADSLKIKRRHFSLTKVDEELYAVGGDGSGGRLDSIEKLVAGKWQLLSQTMETPRSRHCTIYMASKNSLIVIGGYPSTNEVKSLDINSLEWSTLDPLPVSSLYFHSCQLIQENGEDTIYVTGGYHGGYLSKGWKYSRGSWSSAGGQLKQARYSHSMGVRNGKLLVVGGSGGSGRLASLEQMDSIGNWETMPTKLAVARSATAMTAVPVESFKCLP